jgi:hypothetical protein
MMEALLGKKKKKKIIDTTPSPEGRKPNYVGN